MYHLGGGGYVCEVAEVIWEISVLSAPFCCELKTDLKIKVFKKKAGGGA